MDTGELAVFLSRLKELIKEFDRYETFTGDHMWDTGVETGYHGAADDLIDLLADFNISVDL